MHVKNITLYFVLMLIMVSHSDLYSMDTLNIKQIKTWSFTGNLSFGTDIQENYIESIDSTAQLNKIATSRVGFNALYRNNDFYIPISVNIIKELSKSSPTIGTMFYKTDNLFDFLSSPTNYISCSPRYKALEIDLGSQRPNQTELLSNSTPIFGVGLKFNPSLFRFSYARGKMGQAVNPIEVYLTPTNTYSFPGAFSSHTESFKLGIGTERTHIDFNFIKFADDKQSANPDTNYVKAAEGFNSGLECSLGLSRNIRTGMELAVNLLTENRNSEKIDINKQNDLDSVVKKAQGFTKFLYTSGKNLLNFIDESLLEDGLRQSTRTDFSYLFFLEFRYPLWALNLKAKTVGPGYKPIDKFYFQNDYSEYSGTFRYSLLDGRLNMMTLLGYRLNNITKARGPESNNLKARIGAFYKINDEYNFDINASYYDYETRSILLPTGLAGVIVDSLMYNRYMNNINSTYNARLNYTLNTNKWVTDFQIYGGLNNFKLIDGISPLTNIYNYYNMGLCINPKYNYVWDNAIAFDYNFSNGSFKSMCLNLNSGYNLYNESFYPNLNISYYAMFDQSSNKTTSFVIQPALTYKLLKAYDISLQGIVKLVNTKILQRENSHTESSFRIYVQHLFAM